MINIFLSLSVSSMETAVLGASVTFVRSQAESQRESFKIPMPTLCFLQMIVIKYTLISKLLLSSVSQMLSQLLA